MARRESDPGEGLVNGIVLGSTMWAVALAFMFAVPLQRPAAENAAPEARKIDAAKDCRYANVISY
jgi:hypothetical protein